jgi:hypothetical protein
VSFQDKDGKIRDAVRVRWWLPNATTYREAAIVARGDAARIPAMPLPPVAYRWDGEAELESEKLAWVGQ